MALSVDPLTHIITVPKADLTLVSGTLYTHDTDAFRLELKAWEDDFEGIIQPKTHDHNTEVVIAGVTYARAIAILAPYSVEYENGAYSVLLAGSNNNIWDIEGGILVQNTVQVIPGNSAGLVVITSSGNITEQDKLDIADRVWDETLTGANHNIATSSGRRLRQLGDIIAATVVDPTPSVISFITDLTETTDNWYRDQLVRFTTGNLTGLVRPILSYEGSTKTITITEDLPFLPDNGSEFDIIPTHVHSKEEIAGAVWDEPLTAATHNVPTSAGRRLRDTSSAVIHTGTAVSSTVNTITLNGDASAVDGAYDPALISIINGTGFGQTRLVFGYKGSTKTAVVDRNWKILPDATSEYAVISHPGREHVNEGLAQGGTINTITLNALASPDDNNYIGQVISIRSGTGEDQACRVVAYNGTTKVATVAKSWHVTPDATSGYVMLAGSILDTALLASGIADFIWDEDITTHTDADSAGKLVQDTKRDVGDAQGLILAK